MQQSSWETIENVNMVRFIVEYASLIISVNITDKRMCVRTAKLDTVHTRKCPVNAKYVALIVFVNMVVVLHVV